MIKSLLFRFMQSRVYTWFLMHVVPYIRFSMYYTKFPGREFYKAYELLKPGHFLVSKDKKKLTTMLIGGEWTHAAFCVSKDKIFEIAEMTHKNYTKSTFFDFCKENDEIAIYEILDGFGKPVSQAYVEEMIRQCLTYDESLYDGEFKIEAGASLKIPALYCSELVYRSDYQKKMGASLADKAGLGRPYISPTGLTKAKNVRCIYDSRAK